MTIELNHTIIPAKDKWRSAKFLADILGLEAGPEWSHFVPVRTSNGVTLDFAEATEFRRQHYAFLVGEQEFDAALSRIKSAGLAFYADFNRDGRGQINHLYGGRGCYFEDPDGHLMDLRPDARTMGGHGESDGGIAKSVFRQPANCGMHCTFPSYAWVTDVG
jgi:catechol 2,3-dioxygenase-like lactoylglutathione lyase family enzyme